MLDKLKNKIVNNQVIKVDFFENCDIDDLLDMRDEDEFDSEWVRVYNDLNNIEIEEHEQEKIDEISKLSFLMAYNLSDSSDMAACVSDDFEIICKAYFCEYDDIWLNALIMSYARGEFPCGELQTGRYDIKECIKKLVI